ncbi:hypothetical protein SAMN03080601_01467 [Alkalitalea saponilacus]|uniref:Uncharacterized protein n=1 Tax=Alkalitalea saponilacus TaxID=889453 RepID=A0A1T5EYZ1_9BACT|nr:hypothetical protein SAMN03080601_01467 [Alkalitalea saponilacus]
MYTLTRGITFLLIVVSSVYLFTCNLFKGSPTIKHFGFENPIYYFLPILAYMLISIKYLNLLVFDLFVLPFAVSTSI